MKKLCTYDSYCQYKKDDSAVLLNISKEDFKKCYDVIKESNDISSELKLKIANAILDM